MRSESINKRSLVGIKKWSLFFFFSILSIGVFSQETKLAKSSIKSSVTVLNIDTKGFNLDPSQMGNMVRIELEKLDTFEVMDRYDVSYVVEKNKININNCYGKICLLEVGSVINSEKMFTGNVELIGETVVVNFRLIDVKSGKIEMVRVDEYLNLPKELQSMVKISIRKMFNKDVEEPLVTYLTKKNNYFEKTIQVLL